MSTCLMQETPSNFLGCKAHEWQGTVVLTISPVLRQKLNGRDFSPLSSSATHSKIEQLCGNSVSVIFLMTSKHGVAS